MMKSNIKKIMGVLCLLTAFLSTAYAQDAGRAADEKGVREIMQVSDNTGAMYTCGTFSGSCTAGGLFFRAADSCGGFLFKTDAGGHVLWSKTLSAAWLSISAVRLMNNTEILLEGTFRGALKCDGGLQGTAHRNDPFLLRLSETGQLLTERTKATQKQNGNAALRPAAPARTKGMVRCRYDYGKEAR